jgi:hypothetical protein
MNDVGKKQTPFAVARRWIDYLLLRDDEHRDVSEVAAQRLQAIEDRLSKLDGGDDANAAPIAALAKAKRERALAGLPTDGFVIEARNGRLCFSSKHVEERRTVAARIREAIGK